MYHNLLGMPLRGFSVESNTDN